mgnify:CR=1 FL=1
MTLLMKTLTCPFDQNDPKYSVNLSGFKTSPEMAQKILEMINTFGEDSPQVYEFIDDALIHGTLIDTNKR